VAEKETSTGETQRFVTGQKPETIVIQTFSFQVCTKINSGLAKYFKKKPEKFECIANGRMNVFISSPVYCIWFLSTVRKKDSIHVLHFREAIWDQLCFSIDFFVRLLIGFSKLPPYVYEHTNRSICPLVYLHSHWDIAGCFLDDHLNKRPTKRIIKFKVVVT
jgi:hypothetical protein